MKTAEMTIGQDYAYTRHIGRDVSRWFSPSKTTLLATKVNGKAFAYSQRTSIWGPRDPETLARLAKRREEERAQFIATHNLPDLPVVVDDEMVSTVAIAGFRRNYGSDEPEAVIRLVNARYIVESWADHEATQREMKAAEERRRIAREKAEAEKAVAEAARKAKQDQWTNDFPAVRDALASVGIEVAQGIDGLSLSPEKAKALAEFIRSNTTLRAA
jgi:hypothetical protein